MTIFKIQIYFLNIEHFFAIYYKKKIKYEIQSKNVLINKIIFRQIKKTAEKPMKNRTWI